ncbi:hypothetical protein HDU99_003594, partial [Rhizoclosmatium hyalinum]
MLPLLSPIAPTVPTSTPKQPATPSYSCLWQVSSQVPCFEVFEDPQAFYTHLAETHVGRKASADHPLSLNCLWLNCSHADRPFSKRDHIVSHCRAHVSFKANQCDECSATFK